MNAFFLAINRHGQQFSQAVADSMFEQLAPFGRDARQCIVKDNFAIASQQHWLLAEEVGESQPLIKHQHYYFVFNGRVDNRDHLIDCLYERGRDNTAGLSDASLAFEFLLQEGSQGLNDIIGSYSCILFDSTGQECLIARDPMGGRHLSYYVNDKQVLIASYEMAIAAHPAVPYEIDPVKAAEFLGGTFAIPEVSFLRGVSVLQPGYALQISVDNEEKPRQWRFYKPPANRKLTLDSQAEYVQEFKRLLTQAVERRMRCIGNIGSSMSGGFDSVPITILAKQIASRRAQQFKAYSWVFDDYPEADEREFSQDACAHHDISQQLIKCDQVWPSFCEGMALDPLNPFGSPYSEFQQETFRQAAEDGVQVLITGMDGDLLYSGALNQIYELIKAFRLREAVQNFRTYTKIVGSLRTAVINYLYYGTTIAHRISVYRRSKRSQAPNYIVSNLAEGLSLSEPSELIRESLEARRPKQWQFVMGGFAASDYSMGRWMEANYGVERRNPMRDRELCEFMLSIPSEYLHWRGVTRPIVRHAFKNELPESILKRGKKTDFSGMVHSRIQQDQKAKIWFDKQPQHIFNYVRECYFEKLDVDNREGALVWWRSAYYHYWIRECYEPIKRRLE